MIHTNNKSLHLGFFIFYFQAALASTIGLSTAYKSIKKKLNFLSLAGHISNYISIMTSLTTL